MACFLVPMGEAIVTTAIQKVLEKKERNSDCSFKWSQKLKLLNRLLWGGVILLAIEHIWHGEIIFKPPFLTAMKDSKDMAVMFEEMATVGILVSLVVTFIWSTMVIAAEKINKLKETLIKFILA